MTPPVHAAAERVVRQPTPRARRELLASILGDGRVTLTEAAREQALAFNAHLVTAVRVLCETRRVQPPWSVRDTDR